MVAGLETVDWHSDDGGKYKCFVNIYVAVCWKND